MSALRDAMSHAVLGWVKPELDETLRLARSEVEFFAEDPADTSRMHFCAGYLHQVQGTLRMVELYAPAMVAEELELLARALQEKTTLDQDEACGTLMRGTVLLPDYLERLQGGHRDIPIVLLPLLNDIRAARGAPGLSESVLFAPDLEQPLPQELPLPEVLSWQARQTRVGEAQEQLDQALSVWPEEAAPADASALASAVNRLLESVEHIATRRMLWVASSVAEALREGVLPATPALRQAYAGVSRAVRASQQEGAVGAAVPSSQEPTRQLLYLVAQSPARHAALDQLREAFALDAELPSEAELDHARGSVSGRNRALLDTVGAAVKEELLRIKDALDLHLRTGAEVGALQTQVNELGNVADTLGMVGLGVARGVVVQQRDVLREMVQGERLADEGALLDIAGALLYVDASLDDQVARLGEADGGAADSSSSESQRTVEVLAQEAMRNFSAAREGFVAFIETNWDHAELEQVPRLLSEVAGALRMLELPEPADYLLGVRQYVAVELIGKRRVPGGQQLDTLADAMASLEYYLEALRERRPNRDEILDITRSSLEKLRYWPVPAEAPVVQEAALPAEPETPAVVLEDAESASFDAPLESAAETVEPEHSATAEVAMEEEGAEVLALDTEALEALEVEEALQALELEAASLAVQDEAPEDEALPVEALAPADTVPVPSAPAVPAPAEVVHLGSAMGGFETGASDIDDDIREVFLEEFDEEIVNLGQLLPAWTAAPDNMERLRSIRRVFHTLKGSGRLVGAKLLGEFSWKIENMLNRVLEGARPPSGAVIALLEHSTQVLPQLNAALRGQGHVTADLLGLQELSDRVAAGEEAFYKARAETGAVFADPEPESEVRLEFEPETEGTPASVDGVLREILETEVGAHLETVDEWLARAQAAPAHADESLLRAFHTMNGAFAMADVPEITEVTAAAEQYVKRLSSARETASAEGVAVLADSALAIRRSIAALQATSPRIPVFAALAAQLIGLRDSLPEARPSAVIIDDSAQGTYTEAMPSIMPPVSLGDVELSAHDLSAYFGHEAADAETGASAEAAELESGAPAIEPNDDQAIDDQVIDDQAIVLETVQAEPEQPTVTFYDVEMTYVREPVARPPASGDADLLEAAASEETLPEFEEAALQTVQEEEPALEESVAADVGAEASVGEAEMAEAEAIEEVAVETVSIEEPAIDEAEFEAPIETVQVEEAAIEEIESGEIESGAVEPETVGTDSAEPEVEVVEAVIDTVEPP
ncbi:MAG: Hpt domain-containing protein, partial [Pseudoxanthomonas sp.]